MHRLVKLSWLKEPGGETGARPGAEASDKAGEFQRFRIPESVSAAAAPNAVRINPLLWRASFPLRVPRRRAPVLQASRQDRHRTQRSCSTLRSLDERQQVGQAWSHWRQPMHASASNRTETRGLEEKRPRKVPTGHKASQKGRPRRNAQAPSAQKKRAVEKKAVPATGAAGR